MWLYFQISNFQTQIKDRNLKDFLWNCPQVNATRPHCCLVNIGSGNGLKLPYDKTRPQLIYILGADKIFVQHMKELMDK